jgi:hypothetical protein
MSLIFYILQKFVDLAVDEKERQQKSHVFLPTSKTFQILLSVGLTQFRFFCRKLFDYLTLDVWNQNNNILFYI